MTITTSPTPAQGPALLQLPLQAPAGPIGSGIWQGGCWLTASQGRNGWAGKHTHTHTRTEHKGRWKQGLPPAPPTAPLCQTSASTQPPTRPHNTTLFLVLKLLPLGGPPGPIPSLYSRPRPRSNIGHLILQLSIICLPFSLLFFI